MRKRTAILAVLLGALSLPAGAQDKKVCDLKKVEEGLYCEACRKVLEPAELLEKVYCKKCSEGKKGADRVKAVRALVCAKTYYTEDFGTGKDG